MRWRRPRPIQIAAVVIGVLAAACVLALFDKLTGVLGGHRAPEPQLIATVDLRLGNTLLAAERGAAQAREDIEARRLALQTFAPATAWTRPEAAAARQLKQRYGITWLHKADAATPVSRAFADGYNRVMKAEIERRHGADAAQAVERLLPRDAPTPAAGAER